MPSSSVHNVPLVMSIIRSVQPQSVIDVGAGYGKYGFLIREYLGWEVMLVGVDPQPLDHWRMAHTAIYDRFYDQSMFDLYDPRIKGKLFDLALAIDILEHLSKHEGYKLINMLLEMSKAIVISTPRNPAHQEGLWEAHVSRWTPRELKQRYNFADHSTDSTVIGLIRKARL